MRLPLILAVLPCAALAQSVLPPFNATYQAVTIALPPAPGGAYFGYGGTAFLPSNPDVLLYAPYAQSLPAHVYAIPLLRDAQGFITGFAGPATVHATIGGADGGLAFDPSGVLFATWYDAPNRLSQILPGSATANRVDDLAPHGVSFTVGTCAFVPSGLPGAGRFKVATCSNGRFYDLPLTPDGAGTFAPGTAGAPVQLQDTCVEGIAYVPIGAPLLGGQVLIAEYGLGNIVAYQIDGIGNPIPGTRQVVIGNASVPGGGAVDPITGDMVFSNDGFGPDGSLLILRDGAACGSLTGYGVASPGASATPTITGSGCARLGQTIQLDFGGGPNAFGILAFGSTQLNVVWSNLTILQSFNASAVLVLGPTGSASLPLAIPVVAALGNSHAYFQTALLDGSTPSGLAASAGLDVLIR